jgi:exopolyphosphatase / guanosine-5'-triphosphate,3'-diphosphate pyrophosphatase
VQGDSQAVAAAEADLATEPPREDEFLAAVDLGSNSFHMLLARVYHGQLIVMDRLREMVRLAAGLDERNRLDPASRELALACLGRFGQRLREVRADRVRVVGTNTLRKARKARAFIEDCEHALGHPVEIISGREEARLVYLGVAHTMPPEPGTRLVVDIGGGSTELIMGAGLEPRRLESLYMGCVGMTRMHFADGKLSRKRFERARTAAQLELRPVRAFFTQSGWQRAIGSSGTIRAAANMARMLGLSESGITPAAAEALIERMIDAGRVDRLALPGLSAERAPVFAGGISILIEVLSMLGVSHMEASDGALREGLLYDMLGRLQHEDARELSVKAMAARYHVDVEQAERVSATADRLFRQVQQSLGLDDARDRQLLAWAARLHEVGLDIAHTKYHRHGAYLLEHADMPGFPRNEQRMLAVLVGGHRRKLELDVLERLPPSWQRPARRLTVILRLAVLLHRSRTQEPLPGIELRVLVDGLALRVPEPWLAANPLTLADLRQEIEHLAGAGISLSLDPV